MGCPWIVRTILQPASYSRKAHRSSSNLLATINCHCKTRQLHKTECQQTQSKTYLLVHIRTNSTTMLWSQTVHQRKRRTKWSVCTHKSIFTTSSLCKMAKVLAKKRSVTTIPSSQSNCKKSLAAISDRFRLKIIPMQICPSKTLPKEIALVKTLSIALSIRSDSKWVPSYDGIWMIARQIYSNSRISNP